MTFSTIAGMVPFGDLLKEMAVKNPYEGPQLTANMLVGGKANRSAFGTAHSGEVYRLDSQDPLAIYAIAYDRWQRDLCAFILGILEEKGANATLVVDRIDLPSKDIVMRSLRHVPASRLQYSIFSALDYRLKELREYDGATILVSKDAAKAVLGALRSASRPQGGAPELLAKAWYEAQGYDRRGRTIKQLQREMEVATGRAPSESSIRAWEKAAKARK